MYDDIIEETNIDNEQENIDFTYEYEAASETVSELNFD